MSDVSKLPKWAQQKIDTLERDVAHWKEKATAGPEESDTFVAFSSERRPLGKRAYIEFQVLPGHRGQITAYLDDDAGELVIHGGDRIMVLPQASNAIRLRMERR